MDFSLQLFDHKVFSEAQYHNFIKMSIGIKVSFWQWQLGLGVLRNGLTGPLNCKLQVDQEWEHLISRFHPFLLGCGQIHSTVGNLQWDRYNKSFIVYPAITRGWIQYCSRGKDEPDTMSAQETGLGIYLVGAGIWSPASESQLSHFLALWPWARI